MLANVARYLVTCPVFVARGALLDIEPGVSVRFSPAEPPTHSLFNDVDDNNNGVIEIDELLAYLQRRGQTRGRAIALFVALDLSPADCAVSTAEWAAGLLPGLEEPLLTVASLLTWPSLIIERGGQLVAAGTAAAPITLGNTSAGTRGGWGGLIIMGGAPVSPDGDDCHPVSPLCGVTNVSAYGGNEEASSSGVVRYVRVWGAHVGVRLLGVGSGTQIDYVESALSASDGVVVRGGAVDALHVSSLFSAGAALRLGGGYRGRMQYVLAMLGRNGTHGVLVEPEGAACASADAVTRLPRPRLVSLTVLGGGASGEPSSSLLKVAAGAAATVDRALLLYSVSAAAATACNISQADEGAWAMDTAPAGTSLYLGPATMVSPNSSVVDSCGAALLLQKDVPGLASLSAHCLDYACLRGSFFDPLPTADSVACELPPLSAALSAPRFESTQCAGAFGSPHPQANWLAGWTLLLPEPPGTSVSSAVSITLSSTSSDVLFQFTFDTSAFAAGAAFVFPTGRRRLASSASYYDPSQCENTGFSGQGSPLWARFDVAETAVMLLSTCTTQPAAGFDTDLAVFRSIDGGSVSSPADLQQLACNGDGLGQDGCQPLYSRLSFAAEAGVTYYVAVGGYDSSFGSNLTLSLERARPPSPPTPPLPPSPPPPLASPSFLQQLIDEGSQSVPIELPLLGLNMINSTLTVPAPKTVVIRGANSSARAQLSARAIGSMFEVASGAALYLSNVELRDGVAVDGGCGGAIYVAEGGMLVAQHVRFTNNSAARGGAMCIDGSGELRLIDVRFDANVASVAGHDMYLSRPTQAVGQVELLGVALGDAAGANATNQSLWVSQVAQISFDGLWTTTSCPATGGPPCLFVSASVAERAQYASCTPTLTAGGEAYGVECACSANASPLATSAPGEAALAPYGPTPIEVLLNLPSSACIRRLELEIPAQVSHW